MKNYVTIFLIIFPVTIAAYLPVYPQGFNAVSMPGGLYVLAVGDSGKVFRSYDWGLSWIRLVSPPVNFNSISSKGYYVYLTAHDNKIYRTNTYGTSPVIAFPITGNYVFNSSYFITDSIGFMCGDSGAVFKTTNAGVNWSLQNSGIIGNDLNSISFKDSNNGIISADGGHIFVTTNGGASWAPATSVPVTNNNLLKVIYLDDGIVASGEYGTLIVKRNDSLVWNNINTRTKSDIIGITGTGIDEVHICGGGGFIRNNLNNNSGFTNFEPNPMMANLVDIYILDSELGFAVSSLNRAIIKTTNGGQSWNFTQGVFASYQWERKQSSVPGFGIAGNTLCRHPLDRNSFFCGLSNRVFVSRNNGDNWFDIASVPGESMHSFYVSPVDTNIWICAIEGVPDKIMRTSNYGQSWTTSISGNFSPFGQPLEMDQNNPSVLYFAPDGGGFYKSSNSGLTFELISNYPFLSPCDIIVMWDSSEVIFVGDGPNNPSGAKIYRSSDSGYNWTLVLDDSMSSEIPSMCNSVFEKNTMYATDIGEFLRSTDYGLNFNSFFKVGHATWGSAVCEEDPNLILDGIYGNSCYFSLNKGSDWIYSAGTGIYAGMGLLAPYKNNLLYYTTDGIYKLKVIYNGVVSVNENITSANAPENFSLYQNYPNPFNPSTIISYSLNKNSFITLKVFDVLGKEIMTLVNEKQNEGTYEVNFNASGLPSGIYFYKLVSERFSVTKKMVLAK